MYVSRRPRNISFGDERFDNLFALVYILGQAWTRALSRSSMKRVMKRCEVHLLESVCYLTVAVKAAKYLQHLISCSRWQ